MSLTDKQEQVLEAIRTWMQAKGIPPTARELGEALGVTRQTASFHVRNLITAGYLKRAGNGRNSFRPVSGCLPSEAALVPVLDRVPPPGALPSFDEGGPCVAVPASLGEREQLFGWRVVPGATGGNGIVPGDTVIVRVQALTRDGDVVLARIGHGAESTLSLRRQFKSWAGVTLKPMEGDREAAVISGRPGRRTFRVVGKVVGLVRIME